MKYILIILICFLSISVVAQPIVKRANSLSTIEDSRFKAALNMFIPLYADTVSANLSKGIDSTGAMVYTYNTNSLWYRGVEKQWIRVGSGSGGGGDTTVVLHGLDSITFYANTLCQWLGGFSTCFPLNEFFDSVSVNYNGTMYVYYNLGVPKDSVLGITGVPADSIFFVSPLHVIGPRTVSLSQVSAVDSGWVAPHQKVDSSAFRSGLLYNYSDGDSTLVGSIGTGNVQNGLVSVGGTTLVDSTVTVVPNVVYIRNDSLLPPITIPYSWVIHSIDSGYCQSILVYIPDGTNVLDTLEGIKDTGIIVSPALPTGGIAVTYITVCGSEITPPSPVIPTNFWKTDAVNFLPSTQLSFLGTQNNRPLNFYQNNVRRFYADSIGGTKFVDSLVMMPINPVSVGESDSRIFKIMGRGSTGNMQTSRIYYDGFGGVNGGAINMVNDNGYIQFRATVPEYQFIGNARIGGSFSSDLFNRSATLGIALSNDSKMSSGNLLTIRNYGTVAYRDYLRMNFDGRIVIQDSVSSAPAASSILDIRSTTKGILTTRMTGVQMNAIATPATGLLIYNTDSTAFCYYTGAVWRKIATGSSSTVDTTAFVHRLYSINETINGVKTFQDSTLFNSSIHVGGVASVNNNLYVGGQSYFYSGLEATGVAVGPISGGIPTTIFSVTSTTASSIPAPRMTAAEMNAIVAPATASMVFNHDSLAYCYWNGSVWRMIGSGGGGATPTLQQVTDAGNTVTSGANVTTLLANDIIVGDASNESEITATGWYMAQVGGNSAVISLQSSGTSPANLKIPLSSSTARIIPVSVNGNYADAAGDITISGGSSLLPTTGTGTATGTVIGELAGNTLSIANSSATLFTIQNGIANGQLSYLKSVDDAFNGVSGLELFSNDDDYNFRLSSDNNINAVSILGDAETGNITHTAANHIFSGKINLINTDAGVAGTDSILVIKDTEVKKVAASGLVSAKQDSLNWYMPEQYGAVGNGSTNDAAAFQAMHDAMPSTGGRVHLSAKTYRINTQVNFTKTMTIVGSGKKQTTLNTTSATINMFRTTGNYTSWAELSFTNTASTQRTAGAAIYDSLGTNSIFMNINIDSFYNCLNVQQATLLRATNCDFNFYTNYGVYLRNTVNGDSGDESFVGCNFFGATAINSSAGIRWESGGGLKVVNCKFNTSNGTFLPAFGIDASIANTSDLMVSNNSFENFRTSGIKVVSTATPTIFSNIAITGNQFCSFTSTALGDVDLSTVERVAITGNAFRASSPVGNAIKLATITNVTISGNDYGGFVGVAPVSMTSITNFQGQVSGIFTDQSNLSRLSGTFPSTMTGGNDAIRYDITGAGSSSFGTAALRLNYLAGYTGSSATFAGIISNQNAGTGVFTITGGAGNYGTQFGAQATTTGSNLGGMNFAFGGNLNIANYSRANGVKNSAVNIGILANGRNSATSGIGIAAYLTQDTAALSTATASTVIIDNGNQANALTLWRDAGTVVAQVADGGNSFWGGTTSPTAKIHIGTQTTAASTAPIKLTTGTVMNTAEAGAFEYTTPQLFFTNGGAQRQEIPQIQQSRVSTQFDKTDQTLANVTGLTATVVAGKIYRFEATLMTTSDVTGGIKVAIGGTSTATAIRYEAVTYQGGVSVATGTQRAAALATAVGDVTAVTTAYITITGTITVNAAGTLTVQSARNAATGTTSVLTGSTFVLTEML